MDKLDIQKRVNYMETYITISLLALFAIACLLSFYRRSQKRIFQMSIISFLMNFKLIALMFKSGFLTLPTILYACFDNYWIDE